MVKKLLVILAVLFGVFFIGGMFYYGFQKPEASPQSFPQAVKLPLPVQKQDVIFKPQGIWPFGVRGGDHPNGHPGIDFDLVAGAAVLAVVEGKVSGAGDAPGGEDKRITINYQSGGEKVDVWYVGSFKQVLVKEGDQVKTGQFLAFIGPQKGRDFGYLHFETFKMMPFPPGAVCPVEYLEDGAKKDLEELFAKARYNEQREYPLLCNPCPSGFSPFGGCR